MQVLKINKISEIKLYFKNYFGLYKIKDNKIDNDEFNNFVESKKFNHLYKNIISEIVDQKKFDKKKFAYKINRHLENIFQMLMALLFIMIICMVMEKKLIHFGFHCTDYQN